MLRMNRVQLRLCLWSLLSLLFDSTLYIASKGWQSLPAERRFIGSSISHVGSGCCQRCFYTHERRAIIVKHEGKLYDYVKSAHFLLMVDWGHIIPHSESWAHMSGGDTCPSRVIDARVDLSMFSLTRGIRGGYWPSFCSDNQYSW